MISITHYTVRYFKRLSKELVFLLPLVVIGVIMINFQHPLSLFEKTKMEVIINPKNVKAKLVLSKMLIESNNFDKAEMELKTIADNPDAQKKLKKISDHKKSPQKIQEEIKFWQNQIEAYSNSRDSFSKLAILNWKLYRVFEANRHLKKALDLDPNNEVTKKISLRLR